MTAVLRTGWVLANLVWATLFFASVVFVAALLGHRGGCYDWVARGWTGVLLWASGTPVRVEGLEHVSGGEGRVVLPAHVSWYDVLAIANVMPVPSRFVAKKELAKIPIFGQAWRAAGHIEIDRSDRQAAIDSLNRAGRRLHDEGITVIIFPEGTRSRSGRLQRFKKGAFMLAAEAGVPLVPAVVAGSYRVMRPGTWLIHPRPLTVRFGPPVSPGGTDPEEIDGVMKEVRSALLRLGAGEEPREAH
ncbi:MAG: lysophospholipid acyltransferase family protein [Longimicrobiaceae bacterium]